MDRAGKKALPLTVDELKSIFEIVSSGKRQEDVRRCLPERDKTTLYRAYNVAAEFERQKLTHLDNGMAKTISEAAEYSTTMYYVQNLFLKWRAWREETVKSQRVEDTKDQPELVIEFDPQRSEDLGVKTLGGKHWQVACIRCKNVGHVTAKRCWGKLTLLSGATFTGSQGPFYLNPVDEPNTLQRDSAIFVDILPDQHRSWDLVFAPAGKDPTVRITSSGPIYAVSVPVDVRGKSPEEMDWGKGGACIGIPIAMTRFGVPQAHLLPGKYSARVEIYDDVGNRAQSLFEFMAPHAGGKFEVVLLKP